MMDRSVTAGTEFRIDDNEIDAVARTLVRAHLVIAAAGLQLGVALAGTLLAFGVEPFASGPGLAVVGGAFLGAILGLLTGSPAGARLDRGRGTDRSWRARVRRTTTSTSTGG